MDRLKAIRSPERALVEVKKCIKEGRDFIGRGDWQSLLGLVTDIKKILDYLDVWCRVLPYDKLQYRSSLTDMLEKVLAEAREQIMFDYPEKNMYGYNLPVDGETTKKRVLSFTWNVIEEGLNIIELYSKVEMHESQGIFDKYGDTPSNEMPKDLYG